MEPNSIAIHQVFTWNQERDAGTPHKHYLSEELAERRAHRLRLLGHDASVMGLPVNANGMNPRVYITFHSPDIGPYRAQYGRPGRPFAIHTSEAGAEESARMLRRLVDAPLTTWVEEVPLSWDELLNWRKARGRGKA